MVTQQIIDYIRNNIGKFPIETLKQALIKSGVSQQDAEEAASIVLSPQKAPAPPAAQAQQGPAFNFALIIAQAKQVLLDPKTFFQEMPKGGGFIQPLVFMMTMVLAGMVLASGLSLLLTFLRHPALPGIAILIGTAGTFIAAMILVPIFGFIFAGIFYVIWLMMGSRENYETSFRCLAYSCALSPFGALAAPAHLVPYLGALLSLAITVYWFYLCITASTQVHRISQRTASIVFGGIAVLFILLSLASMIALRSTRKLLQSVGMETGYQTGYPSTKKSLEKFASGISALSEIAEKQGAAKAGRYSSGGATTRKPWQETAGAGMAGTGESEPDLDKAMQAFKKFSTKMSGGKEITPVDFRKLKALLPQRLKGMRRTDADSSRQAFLGMSVSQAKATYTASDGARIEIKIVDSGGMSGISSFGWGMAQSMAEERESNTGYKKIMKYSGHSGFEEYNYPGRQGKVSVSVADRFLVEVNGSGVEMTAIKKALRMVPLDRLEKMKTLGGGH